MEVFDLFLLGWIGIGVVFLIGYSVSEKEMPGSFEGMLMILFGPLFLLWFGLTELLKGAGSSTGQVHAAAPQKPTRSPVDEYEELMAELSQKFLQDSADTKLVKGDFVKLQRLGNLTKVDAIGFVMDASDVARLLNAGLLAIDDVYEPGSSIAESREKSIRESIARLERRAGGTPANGLEGSPGYTESAGAEWKTVTKIASLSEARTLVRKALRRHADLRDELLTGLDDEWLFLSKYDLRELIELGDGYHALAKALIRFYASSDSATAEELCGLAELCIPDELNDDALMGQLAAQARSMAASSSDYLSLATLAQHAGNIDALDCVRAAVDALEDSDDAYRVVAHKACTAEVFAKVKQLVLTKVDSREFWSIYDPYDILSTGVEHDFLAKEEVFGILENLLNTEAPGLSWERIAGSMGREASPELYERCLEKAEASALTPEEKFSLYEYMVDSLEDADWAERYKERVAAAIETKLHEREAAQADSLRLDVVCQCALLAALGDGKISSEELEEVQQIRAVAELFLKNRAAITVLEKSGDIEQARAARVETEVFVVRTLFGRPDYLNDVLDALSDAAGTGEGNSDSAATIALILDYASRLEDPFARRVGLWAAREVAAVDGLDEGEEKVLQLLASAWALDMNENARFFAEVVYPAVNDGSEYTGGGDDESLLDLAKAADAERQEGSLTDDQEDPVGTLIESLGIDSLEDLVRSLTGESESTVEDTDPLPPLFAAVLEHADWYAALARVEGGDDPNATINLSGMAGLPLLTLAAEHAPVETIERLIELGADVNSTLENVDVGPGYQCPLVASLKGGGRMEVFNVLLARGANPDPFSDKESGSTPLLMAAMNLNLPAINRLLDLGAAVNTADSSGCNAYKLISANESPEAVRCLRRLIKADIDTQRRDAQGYAGIHNAVCHGSVDLVKLHVEAGKVNVDLPLGTWRGKWSLHTPLLKAIAFGNLPVVEYLLQAGASVKARNERQSIFTAIAQGAVDGNLDEPNAMAERMLALGATPAFRDLLTLIGQLDESDDEDLGWAVPYASLLIANGAMDTFDIDEVDGESLGESIRSAEGSAPETTGHILELIDEAGVDLDALAA